MRLAGQSLTVTLSLVGSNTSLLRYIQHDLLALSNTDVILRMQRLHLPTSRYQISLATSETHPSDSLISPSQSLRNFRPQWKLIHAKKYDRLGTSGKLGTLRYALRRRSSKSAPKAALHPIIRTTWHSKFMLSLCFSCTYRNHTPLCYALAKVNIFTATICLLFHPEMHLAIFLANGHGKLELQSKNRSRQLKLC
jgi:hypothetical protein